MFRKLFLTLLLIFFAITGAFAKTTLQAEYFTTSTTDLSDVEENFNVTWDDTEKCAVFNGTSATSSDNGTVSYLRILNPLTQATAETGFTIKMDVFM